MEDEQIKPSDLPSVIEFDATEQNYGPFCIIRTVYRDGAGNVVKEGEYIFIVGADAENDELRKKFALEVFDSNFKYRIRIAKRRRQDLKHGSTYLSQFRHGYYILGYRLDLEEAKDCQTNFGAELVDAVWNIFSKGGAE